MKTGRLDSFHGVELRSNLNTSNCLNILFRCRLIVVVAALSHTLGGCLGRGKPTFQDLTFFVQLGSTGFELTRGMAFFPRFDGPHSGTLIDDPSQAGSIGRQRLSRLLGLSGNVLTDQFFNHSSMTIFLLSLFLFDGF